MFDLSGRVAVVTGGLGKLGQQFSAVLARFGARVAVCDIVTASSAYLPEFKQALDRGFLRIIQADVTSREAVQQALHEISRTWSIPHVLINNAAIDSPPDAPAEENGPFEDYPQNSLDRIVDVNIKGTFIPCQVFGGAMAKEGRGSIINISSIYGMVSPVQDIYEYKRRSGQAWYKPAPYSVTKSGILNLTRYLATYWARQGVRVNTLTPAGIFNNQDEAFLKEYQKRVPMGRMANPDELNGAIVFLASDASSYMTGANLVIDGGWTAW